jgi:hypothetical protein
VEQKPEDLDDDEWDRLAIDFALKRLARKKAAIANFREQGRDFPAIEPAMLLCAKDTSHADALAALLKDRFGFSEDEVLVTHSDKKLSEK